MNVIFMGTPDFSVGILEEIIKAGHKVLLAVTQPDKPKGRGKSLQYPPVKECALAHDIPVFQPDRIRKPENVEYLRQFGADIMIVAAFGQILPKEILNMPKYGCINVHASLLPKYRGAAPIQWAVINGDETTGVTIMRMDEGIDTGDMIAKREVAIAADETGGSLFDRLSRTGAELLVNTLAGLENGTVTPKRQEGEISYAGKLTKSSGLVDFNRTADDIERLVRGLSPWPAAYSYIDGKSVKIWKSHVEDIDCSSMEPGTVYTVDDAIHVSTGKGGLVITELQLESKKRMDSDAFLRGFHITVGTKFG